MSKEKILTLDGLRTFKDIILNLLSGKAPVSHAHPISDVTNLQALLDNKTFITTITVPMGRMRGDVDGDGKITNADYELVYNRASNNLTEIQLWCADVVGGNGTVNAMDISSILNYINGKGGTLTSVPTFADYYGNWTYSKIDNLTGEFYVDFTIADMTTTSNAVISIAGAYEKDNFRAECMNGVLRLYAKWCPIAETTAIVQYHDGDGTTVVVSDVDVSNYISNHNESTEAHADIREQIKAITAPTKFSDLEQDSLRVTTDSGVYMNTSESIDLSASAITIQAENDLIVSCDSSMTVESTNSDLYVTAECELGLEGKTYGAVLFGTSTADNKSGEIKLGKTNGVDITSPQKVVVSGTNGVDINGNYLNVTTVDDLSLNCDSSMSLNSTDSDIYLNANGCIEMYATNYGVLISGASTNKSTSGKISVGQDNGIDINSDNNNINISSGDSISVSSVNGVEIKGTEGSVAIKAENENSISLNATSNINIDGANTVNMETAGDLTIMGKQSVEVSSPNTTSVIGSTEVNIKSDETANISANEVYINGAAGVGITSNDLISIRSTQSDININAEDAVLGLHGSENVIIESPNGNIELNSKIKYGTPVAINDTYSAIPIVNNDGVERYMLLGTSIDALTVIVNMLSAKVVLTDDGNGNVNIGLEV